MPAVGRRSRVLSLSLFIIGLDNTILNVALPTMQAEFDASPRSSSGWSTPTCSSSRGCCSCSARSATVSGASCAPGGRLDLRTRQPRRAVADSADQVIAVRALMGVGAALIMPATLSIIANLFTGKERGKAIAIWAALAAVGIGLGPLAGGLLLEWFDWWSVFLVNVPVAAAALLLGIRYVPESRDPRPGSFDLLGAALSTAGFSLLVYAIIEAPEKGWTSGLSLGLLATSVALLGGFLWWERRIDEPMLDLGFFRSARFSVGTAAVSVAFFALLGGIFALTQYLQFAHGYSAIEAGAVMSPIALGLMIGAGSSSKPVGRLGTARVVAAGLTGLAILLALTALFEPDTGRSRWSPGSSAWRCRWAGSWPPPPRRSWARCRRQSRASPRPPTPSHAWSRRRSASPSSARSSAPSTRRTSTARSAPFPRGRKREPRTRSAPPTRSPLTFHPRRLRPARDDGDAFTQAMGTGLLIAGAVAAVMAVLVARFLPARETVAAKAEDSDPTAIPLADVDQAALAS